MSLSANVVISIRSQTYKEFPRMWNRKTWNRWLMLSLVAGLSMLSLGAPTQSRAAGIPTIGKRVALVMGNDAYQNVGKLEKAGNDASAMARELRAAGLDLHPAFLQAFNEMLERPAQSYGRGWRLEVRQYNGSASPWSSR